MRAYQEEAGVGEFMEKAAEFFGQLVARLRSPEMKKLDHGEVEDFLEVEGRELDRLLFQAFLDELSDAEHRYDEVVGSDGLARTHVRKMERCLESKFGRVSVGRLGYSARSSSSLCPLDAVLNLPPDMYSQGVRRSVADQVAKGSYDEAVAEVATNTSAWVPKFSAEKLAREVSQDFNAFYAGRLNEPENSQDLLVLTMDAKGIVVRREDLRPETRKLAERESGRKRKKRLASGEKRNRKRMAQVAAVYTVAPHLRTAEQIMSSDDSQQRVPGPPIHNKRVWASVQQEPEQVIEDAFQEALSRDPLRRRSWVVLVDGAASQLRLIRTVAKRHQVKIRIVLDFAHVLEYLWKASYCFHRDGTQEAEDWVAERALRLLRGQAGQVAAGMGRSATLRGLRGKDRKPVDTCAKYLLKHKRYLRYEDCLARGFPIGTGVVEGACRHVVKDRMDVTGARWSLDGAEAVLRLRSLRSSGDFEAYWKFHTRVELRRNHLSRFRNLPLAVAA